MENETLRKVEKILNAILKGKQIFVINTDGSIFELKPNLTLLSKHK